MSLTLSSADVAQFQMALAALVAPLAYGDVATWRHATRAAGEPLVGAYRSVSWLALEGEPLAQVPPGGEEVIARREAYLDGGPDPGIERWRRDKERLTVATHAEFYPLTDDRARAYHFEVALRFGIQNVLYLLTDVDAEGPPAALIFELPGNAPAAQMARGVEMLRLLQPAFAAGMQACVRLARQRRVLGRLVDALPDGVALCDAGGCVTHRNPALAAFLAADVEAARLAAQIARVAASAAAIGEPRRGKAAAGGLATEPLLREVRTAVGRYRLHASYAGRDLLGPGAAVVVLVARLEAPELTATQLRARYGLTAREIEVAYLLARGRRNADVARLLGLRPATARHYTEHTLAKLGLHSRAEVACTLRGDPTAARGSSRGSTSASR